MMPFLGSIMTIAVDSATTVSTSSVFEENMTWSRSTGGSTSSSNEAFSTRAILNGEQRQRRITTTVTDNRENRLTGEGEEVDGPSEKGIRDNEKHIEGGSKRDIIKREKEKRIVKKKAFRYCKETSETRVCGSDVISVTGREKITFTGEEAGTAGTKGNSEESVDVIGSTADSVGVSTGASNSTEEEEEEEEVGIEYGKGVLLFSFSDTMEDIGTFNDSFNTSLRYPCNISLCNDTYIVMGEGMYPSGYTLPHIILASIIATLLMIVIIVGNMLVIIAIATEKALKNIQNWFIASLAVADFFLGLVVMPFSLANEIMGYWIFGYWWCDIYSAMDVLLCTASIMNLCLISLDRFWSITQAVDYLRKRTPARAALMITLVWLMSALVCIPPLLGWKRATPAEQYPKCEVSPRYYNTNTIIRLYCEIF